MLTTHSLPGHSGTSPAIPAVPWIDLLDPTSEERASVEGRHGLKLPSREALGGIEASSRISTRNGVLYLSMPTISHMGELEEPASPLGFVLSKDLLVTLRYAELHSFDTVAERCSKGDGIFTSVETFAALVDEMVDLNADLIERIAAELDGVSRAIFSKLGTLDHVTQSNEELRRVLIGVGHAGERLSRIRDAILGLQRIVPFVAATEQDWIPHNIRVRLTATHGDLTSLAEYETHLSDKVQFLLDAVLGFINTKQNDIFQVLTVISIVGIPPTLVASIYGMNFKNMPELTWAWGYPYALVVILLSAVLPIAWFKWRRWV